MLALTWNWNIPEPTEHIPYKLHVELVYGIIIALVTEHVYNIARLVTFVLLVINIFILLVIKFLTGYMALYKRLFGNITRAARLMSIYEELFLSLINEAYCIINSLKITRRVKNDNSVLIIKTLFNE
jgi:hypothetical protein